MSSTLSRPSAKLLRTALTTTLCVAAAASGPAWAAKPGGGGGGGSTTPWNVRLHGGGDSIMRGYNATCTGNTSFFDLLCYSGGDQPENSFFSGSSSSVKSLEDYFKAAGATTTANKNASQSGSEMVGGTNNFRVQALSIAATANAVAGRPPVQVKIELGGNDICNRTSTGTMYSDEVWRTAIQAGLNVLTNQEAGTQGLPPSSSVVLVGVPRVQDLYAVGVAKSNGSSRVNCPSFWETYDVCEIATVNRSFGGELLPARLTAIAARQARYNQILKEEAAAFKLQAGSTGVEVVAETDGAFSTRSPEVGNYSFTASEINGGDCFHPSIAGQNKLATIVWGNDPYRVRPQ